MLSNQTLGATFFARSRSSPLAEREPIGQEPDDYRSTRRRIARDSALQNEPMNSARAGRSKPAATASASVGGDGSGWCGLLSRGNSTLKLARSLRRSNGARNPIASACRMVTWSQSGSFLYFASQQLLPAIQVTGIRADWRYLMARCACFSEMPDSAASRAMLAHSLDSSTRRISSAARWTPRVGGSAI